MILEWFTLLIVVIIAFKYLMAVVIIRMCGVVVEIVIASSMLLMVLLFVQFGISISLIVVIIVFKNLRAIFFRLNVVLQDRRMVSSIILKVLQLILIIMFM